MVINIPIIQQPKIASKEEINEQLIPGPEDDFILMTAWKRGVAFALGFETETELDIWLQSE